MESKRFSHIGDATREDWGRIFATVEHATAAMPSRVLSMLESLRNVWYGFPVDQLDHALQCARRAELAGEDDEIVLAALCHDLGKVVNVWGHEFISAAILRPYVSEDTCWIVENHQAVQSKYLPMFAGRHDQSSIDQHPCGAAARRFVEEYDAPSFATDFDTPPLERYVGLVERFFARPRDAVDLTSGAPVASEEDVVADEAIPTTTP